MAAVSTSYHHKLGATRIIVGTAGTLCGISGLEHGFFETLQGNVAPDGLLFAAIGPANRFWPGGTEHALSVIPNLQITGILAMLASLAVIIWSVAFIQKKHGALVFLALSIVQFLVGGGFGQIFLVLLAAVAATQINANEPGWRLLSPGPVQRFLAKWWIGLTIAFALSFSLAMFTTIFGYFPVLNRLFQLTPDNLAGFLYGLGYLALGLLLLAVLSGFAHDRNLE